MKFVDEVNFKVREGKGEVVYDENLDKYGLLVDGIFFSFLNKDQAKMLEQSLDDSKIENYFNSIGIGPEFLNMQPKAACFDDYVRPTGDINFKESKMKEDRVVRIRFSDNEDASDFIEQAKEEFNYPEKTSKYQVVHGKSKRGGSVFIESALFDSVLRRVK